MSNNIIDDVIPKILTTATTQLAEELPILQYVNRQYEVEARKQGDVIWVPIESEAEVYDVVPGHTANNNPGSRTDAIPVSLSEWKEAVLVFDDKDLKMIADGIMPGKVQQRVRAIRNSIASYIWNQYVYSYHTVGTPGVTPFATDADFKNIVKNCKRTLNKELANSISRNRVGLLDTDAEANLSVLDQFLHADKAGSDMTLRTGMVGNAMGISWAFDNSEPEHTANTLSTRVGFTTGAAVQEIEITNELLPRMNPEKRYIVRFNAPVGATGALKKGDIFSVAGDSQTYVVEAPVTIASGHMNVQFYPEPQQTWAVNSAINIMAPHAVNLVMHDKAIAFVMAPFTKPSDSGMPADVSVTYTDPVTGIPLRLEIYKEYKQYRWSLDALFGARPIYRKHMIRLLG